MFPPNFSIHLKHSKEDLPVVTISSTTKILSFFFISKPLRIENSPSLRSAKIFFNPKCLESSYPTITCSSVIQSNQYY